LASGPGSTSPSTNVNNSPVKEVLTSIIGVTEFKDVVNCCPVKVRFAVPVTVTEFKDVFNNCPVTFATFIVSIVTVP
jgi:hypothetical protein